MMNRFGTRSGAGRVQYYFGSTGRTGKERQSKVKNKVIDKAKKAIDEAAEFYASKHAAQIQALAQYEAELQAATEEAEAYLNAGNMPAFQLANKKEVEARATVERVKSYLSIMEKQPIMKEKDAADLEQTIMDELNRVNKSYREQIFQHLQEVDRLATELYEQLNDGSRLYNRIKKEIERKRELAALVRSFSPDVLTLRADLRQLRYYNCMKELKKKG